MSNSPPQHVVWADVDAQELPGFDGRATVKVVTGALGQVMLVELVAGVVFPNPDDPSEQETHPIEQFLNILSGRVRAVVAGSEYIVSAGESLVLPPDVPHVVSAVEDTKMLEVFAPRVLPG